MMSLFEEIERLETQLSELHSDHFQRQWIIDKIRDLEDIIEIMSW